VKAPSPLETSQIVVRRCESTLLRAQDPYSLLLTSELLQSPDHTLHHVCSRNSPSIFNSTLTAYRRLIIRDDPQAASKYIADYIIGA
jgi:hypothetical protein